MTAVRFKRPIQYQMIVTNGFIVMNTVNHIEFVSHD